MRALLARISGPWIIMWLSLSVAMSSLMITDPAARMDLAANPPSFGDLLIFLSICGSFAFLTALLVALLYPKAKIPPEAESPSPSISGITEGTSFSSPQIAPARPKRLLVALVTVPIASNLILPDSNNGYLMISRLGSFALLLFLGVYIFGWKYLSPRYSSIFSQSHPDYFRVEATLVRLLLTPILFAGGTLLSPLHEPKAGLLEDFVTGCLLAVVFVEILPRVRRAEALRSSRSPADRPSKIRAA